MSRFTALLANARDLKQVPGRKSDVRDCQWIARLLQCGLLKGGFIPTRVQRELRDLTRHRTQLVEEKTRTINRIQKVLEDANIKLASVASNVMGVSGRAMIQRLIEGDQRTQTRGSGAVPTAPEDSRAGESLGRKVNGPSVLIIVFKSGHPLSSRLKSAIRLISDAWQRGKIGQRQEGRIDFLY